MNILDRISFLLGSELEIIYLTSGIGSFVLLLGYVMILFSPKRKASLKWSFYFYFIALFLLSGLSIYSYVEAVGGLPIVLPIAIFLMLLFPALKEIRTFKRFLFYPLVTTFSLISSFFITLFSVDFQKLTITNHDWCYKNYPPQDLDIICQPEGGFPFPYLFDLDSGWVGLLSFSQDRFVWGWFLLDWLIYFLIAFVPFYFFRNKILNN